MSNPSNLVDFKENKIRDSLSGSMGLVIMGNNCVVVGLKAKYQFSFSEELEDGSRFFILGIGGSEPDLRDFQFEFLRFRSKFITIFSERDLNLSVIMDFSSSYLRKRYYAKTAEPTSLELIVGAVNKSGMIFRMINYTGSSGLLGQDSASIITIGCYGSNREEVLEKLSKFDTQKLNGNSIIKNLQPCLEPFSGDLGWLVFTITNKKTKKRK